MPWPVAKTIALVAPHGATTTGTNKSERGRAQSTRAGDAARAVAKTDWAANPRQFLVLQPRVTCYT